MPVVGVPGQPVLPPIGRVEQVPAREHYLPFGVMYEPPDLTGRPFAPRYHGVIGARATVPNRRQSLAVSRYGPNGPPKTPR